MSKDYEKFHEIPPFKVKADPSILINDEDYPWLGAISKWHKQKKSEDFLPQLLWWYHANFVTDEYDTIVRFVHAHAMPTFSEFIWKLWILKPRQPKGAHTGL